MSRTSAEWWEEVKSDNAKLNEWLIKQHRGEATAAARIRKFSEEFAADPKIVAVLHKIADDEDRHAGWVVGLLNSRGIVPDTANAEERYWQETLPGIKDFQTGTAVACLAEAMRLERIKVIVADPDSPEDIRSVFSNILKDELFHEQAFRKLTTEEAINSVEPNHVRALERLGLII